MNNRCQIYKLFSIDEKLGRLSSAWLGLSYCSQDAKLVDKLKRRTILGLSDKYQAYKRDNSSIEMIHLFQ